MKFEHNMWILTIMFQLFHTHCVRGMCNTAAYPMKVSESEYKAWKQTWEERAAQFMQGVKECSAVCL